MYKFVKLQTPGSTIAVQMNITLFLLNAHYLHYMSLAFKKNILPGKCACQSEHSPTISI